MFSLSVKKISCGGQNRGRLYSQVVQFVGGG